ncbi:DUF7577 domain-containing protein [Natrialba hulunbeirensis]
MRETTASSNSTVQGSCPYCSAENDFFYTFCRNCLQELPSNARRHSPH